MHSEVSIRETLDPGRYAIVCSTKMAGQEGDYRLSLYFNSELRDINLYCVTDAKIKYKIVPVEYEKNNVRVPDWKRKFVKESLDYMINETDFSLSKKGTLNQSATSSKINSSMNTAN